VVTGYYGGGLDALLMSAVDVLLAFLYLLLALLIVTGLGPGLTNAMIAVGIVYVPIYARLVRAMVFSVKARDYVLAARALGASSGRIMLRHVLADSLSPIIVQTSLSFGSAIVSAATLSFLGLGAQPPSPEWGAMLNQGREYMARAPWVATFPGLAILLVAIGCNLLGDGLRDALDPRLKS
jgi:peptide/nickel transport system permease protein